MAKAISDIAIKHNKKAKVHIKVDTGMTRIGLSPDAKGLKAVEKINGLPGIEMEGLFSHFALADSMDRSYTEMQFARFINFYGMLEKSSGKTCLQQRWHYRISEIHLDMVFDDKNFVFEKNTPPPRNQWVFTTSFLSTQGNSHP